MCAGVLATDSLCAALPTVQMKKFLTFFQILRVGNQETTSDVVVSTMFDVKTTCEKLMLNIIIYLEVVSMNQFSNMGLDFQYFSSYSYHNFNYEFLVRASHLHGDDYFVVLCICWIVLQSGLQTFYCESFECVTNYNYNYFHNHENFS